MKIVEISTIVLDDYPNAMFLEITTDEGLVGLGEAFIGARAVESYLHETAAPYLLGRDPMDLSQHHLNLRGYVGFEGSGVETRGNGAIDIALWDLVGKIVGQPLFQLLGGKCRESSRIYNTCAGPGYMKDLPNGVDPENWGLPDTQVQGTYEDLYGFMHCADELAEDLLQDGVTAMKIWPFDKYVAETGGHGISTQNLKEGLEPLNKIRHAVGDSMDVMVELHGLWDVPTAKKIAHALEDLNPFWLEDPVRTENLDALAEVAASTKIPIAAGETLGGSVAFSNLLQRDAASVIIFDVGWCGGITTAKSVATLVDVQQLPVAPHDCTGPVVLAASVHLTVSLPNGGLQETVRASYRGWYNDVVTGLPPITQGRIAPSPAPGLGVSLQPDLKKLLSTHVKTSTIGGR